MESKSAVEFENDRVRVSRIKGERGGDLGLSSREDRLIVYLADGKVVRHQGAAREEIERKAGDVVWRDASEHQIENKDPAHEVLIIEFKK
jgi:quercetin dioxygenase-like cupin family protein